MNSSESSLREWYVYGSSTRGPQVWTMGLRANPSIDVNDTAMLSGKMSLPVVYFKKVPSIGASDERMNFFRKSRDCLSASLLGLHSIDLTTFLVVGCLAVRSGVVKGSYFLSSIKIGAQH